ncbi:MAG: YkgJ family cysteine cluster protein [Hyphomicrobiaceae bacterium]|nr:YkgJ family cysteine cluster protein [Hyphomicrobiaceae bacterium]
MAQTYDCEKCPGYCCSYPLIALTRRDVERLARFHEMTFDAARAAFTEVAWGRKYAMKRKSDQHFGKICRFFDTTARRCTIYEGRPKVCRDYPHKKRCGYYDFLAFEREAQSDPAFIALTDHG